MREAMQAPQTDSSEPDYKTKWYTKVSWNFKFLKCSDTGKTIWPLQKAWKHTYWNVDVLCAFDRPPIKRSDYISDKAYMVRILSGKTN